jgi:hypothetical protein
MHVGICVAPRLERRRPESRNLRFSGTVAGTQRNGPAKTPRTFDIRGVKFEEIAADYGQGLECRATFKGYV